ncbi:hypothetical protein ACFOLC_16160, partial [Lysobacter cavernae]
AAVRSKGILVKKALASGHACLKPGEDPLRRTFELLMRHPGMSSAIIGTINSSHLRENVSYALAAIQQRL